MIDQAQKGIALCICLAATNFAYAHHTSNFSYQSWLSQALHLQHEIDKNAPLREASFLGTHNSYNSEAYQIPFVRYLDPNQTLSIFDQLEVGVRSIELDAHWTWSDKFKKEILLCHGQPSHFGCSLYDRPFKEALIELRNWIETHANEILLIYIEQHLDGHGNELAKQLEEYLGPYIFKPQDLKNYLRDRHLPAQSCLSLPTEITKSFVLQQKKQIIFVAKECQKNPTLFNDYVFAGIGTIPLHPFTFLDTTITHFTPYPDCARTTVFQDDVNHNSLWRVFEDRTAFSNVIRFEKKFLADDMPELLRCGINWPALDMLAKNDDRLTSYVWSWAPYYPKTNNGHCAVYENNFGIKNVDCSNTYRAFACQEVSTHDIKVTLAQANWSQGETICQRYQGKNWHFAIPLNGQQMYALKTDMDAKQLQEVWLNYSSNSNDEWQVHG